MTKRKQPVGFELLLQGATTARLRPLTFTFPNKVARTREVVADVLILELRLKGQLVGIEILSARSRSPRLPNW